MKIVSWTATLVLACSVASHVGCRSDSSARQTPGTEPSPDPQAQAADAARAKQIVTTYCGSCHKSTPVQLPAASGDQGVGPRIPAIDYLKQLPPGAIVLALERGTMRTVGQTLSSEQRVAVAEYLTGKKYDRNASTGRYCPPGKRADLTALDGPSWVGWGNGPNNQRFQAAPAARLAVADIPRLKLKWAFELPGSRQGVPMVVHGSRLFLGAPGRVYSLDKETGCIHWTVEVQTAVRTAIHIQEGQGPDGPRRLALFGTEAPSFVHAVDALTGEHLWEKEVPSGVTQMTASPQLHEGTLYAPLSNGPESHFLAMDPKYECCTGRGAIYALDALTGDRRWLTFMVPEPQKTVKTKAGVQMWGPSGASVWLGPAVDAKLGRLYVPTGQNASPPATKTADAIVALDMKTGEMLWSNQGHGEEDIWNGSCLGSTGADENCPFKPNTGYDSSAPLLISPPSGQRLIIAADKTGLVRALDPDKDGAVVWKRSLVSVSGPLGGPAHFAMATDGENVYVPLNGRDVTTKKALGHIDIALDHEAGELVALRLVDGSVAWRAVPPPGTCKDKGPYCFRGLSAPPVAIPGAVFQGALDGHLRAYSTKDGSILWDLDTTQAFDSPTGKVNGGSIDGAGGPILVDGTLFVTSGYSFLGEMPGNALLAFSVDGK